MVGCPKPLPLSSTLRRRWAPHSAGGSATCPVRGAEVQLRYALLCVASCVANAYATLMKAHHLWRKKLVVKVGWWFFLSSTSIKINFLIDRSAAVGTQLVQKIWGTNGIGRSVAPCGANDCISWWMCAIAGGICLSWRPIFEAWFCVAD